MIRRSYREFVGAVADTLDSLNRAAFARRLEWPFAEAKRGQVLWDNALAEGQDGRLLLL